MDKHFLFFLVANTSATLEINSQLKFKTAFLNCQGSLQTDCQGRLTNDDVRLEPDATVNAS